MKKYIYIVFILLSINSAIHAQIVLNGLLENSDTWVETGEATDYFVTNTATVDQYFQFNTSEIGDSVWWDFTTTPGIMADSVVTLSTQGIRPSHSVYNYFNGVSVTYEWYILRLTGENAGELLAGPFSETVEDLSSSAGYTDAELGAARTEVNEIEISSTNQIRIVAKVTGVRRAGTRRLRFNHWVFNPSVITDAQHDKLTYKENFITLQPNPSVDNYSIIDLSLFSSDKVTIQLISMNGELLFETETTDSAFELKTEGYDKGLYFVNVSGSSYYTTSKIFID